MVKIAHSLAITILQLHGFQRWCTTFELLEYTEQIESLLKDTPPLRAMHGALVPARVSYRDFWQRYFYQLHLLHHQEQRRVELLKRPSADNLVSSSQSVPAASPAFSLKNSHFPCSLCHFL